MIRCNRHRQADTDKVSFYVETAGHPSDRFSGNKFYSLSGRELVDFWNAPEWAKPKGVWRGQIDESFADPIVLVAALGKILGRAVDLPRKRQPHWSRDIARRLTISRIPNLADAAQVDVKIRRMAAEKERQEKEEWKRRYAEAEKQGQQRMV